MGILALYDTAGIQSFIYRSNRLRDNQGASRLVEECFQVYLCNTIKGLLKKNVFQKIHLEWQSNKENGEADIRFLSEDDMDCEVIYIGGGNALLYLRDIHLYKKLNTEFSRELLREIPGLTVISEMQEIEDTGKPGQFGKDLEKLLKRLQLKKMKGKGNEAVPCLSVTRECSETHKPAVSRDPETQQYISSEIQCKRNRIKDEIKKTRYKEMNALAGREGEKWIAVVHIDGNDMGSNISKLLQGSDYRQGITDMRRFSCQIQELYDRSWGNVLTECGKIIMQSKDGKLKPFQDQSENGGLEVPFRKIYGAGDDLTFVCFGPLAIKAAEIFLRELDKEKKKMDIYPNIDISACAGIVFVKPTYPFFRAYMLAEACCRNAKRKARREREENAHESWMGNYIDFQLVHGNLGSLENLRREDYQVCDNNGEVWDLLMRPYAVIVNGRSTLSMNRCSMDIFYDISRFIQKGGIARSKMKELRDSYYKGEDSVRVSVAEIKRRYGDKLQLLNSMLENRLPLLDKKTYLWTSGEEKKAVLWDALEMMDLYIDVQTEVETDEI